MKILWKTYSMFSEWKANSFKTHQTSFYFNSPKNTWHLNERTFFDFHNFTKWDSKSYLLFFVNYKWSFANLVRKSLIKIKIVFHCGGPIDKVIYWSTYDNLQTIQNVAKAAALMEIILPELLTIQKKILSVTGLGWQASAIMMLTANGSMSVEQPLLQRAIF